MYNNFFVSKVSFWHRPDVQSFLTAVIKSHAIYTLRFNDILWQSTAIKLFMLPSRIWMFQDFAYEHITFRSTSGSFSNRSATEECAQVGAFVLGSDGAKHEPARVRAREILRKRACLVASSVTRKNGRITRLTQRLTLRCTIARPDDSSALDAITFGGSVSTEQPFCDRVPAPYYCANKEDLLTAAGLFVNSEARRAARVCNQTQACAREAPARRTLLLKVLPRPLFGASLSCLRFYVARISSLSYRVDLHTTVRYGTTTAAGRRSSMG